MRETETVHLEATCIKETDEAIFVILSCDEVREPQAWIPKSQISDDSEVRGEGDAGTLIISEWIATEKGLV